MNSIDSRSGSAPAIIALDRTLRLMRDDLQENVNTDILLNALTSRRVTIAADRANLQSSAAQSAVVALTMLLLRSGTSVNLCFPETELNLPHPLLQYPFLMQGLLDVSTNVIDGIECKNQDGGHSNVAILLGDTRWNGNADLVIRLSANELESQMIPATNCHGVGTRWSPTLKIHFGAMACAALAAGEVFKQSMRHLSRFARNQTIFSTLFAVSQVDCFSLGARIDTTREFLHNGFDLGRVDAISGGAIMQSVLFILAGLPGLRGNFRIWEPEASDATNLNRYMLLLRRSVNQMKLETLRSMNLNGITVYPIPERYIRGSHQSHGGLSEIVIVGVDDIPTRWHVQEGRPAWLGIGATSHYSAMSSEHTSTTPCARCLHPTDAGEFGAIPTVGFVSFWAGLLLAWRLVRAQMQVPCGGNQYDYFTPLRSELPDAMWQSPVGARPTCPNHCARRVAA